jgi:hypothetical protein
MRRSAVIECQIEVAKKSLENNRQQAAIKRETRKAVVEVIIRKNLAYNERLDNMENNRIAFYNCKNPKI